jgi:protein-S-isoprenylcysteine O-methyltransferase Ste14
VHSSSWIAWTSYFAGFVLMVLLAPGAADDISRFGTGAWVMIGGVLAFFAAVIYLQRQMRLQLNEAHYGAPEHLVTAGPFSLSRNPIYLAFLIPLAALAWYSPVAALAALVLYVIIITRFVILGEETVLEAKFGDVYREYRRRTPRWLFV